MRYKVGNAKLNKTLMLIAVLAMALLLCGCRTRISNNTEVASTITDDEGWMQELYQSRRDELGIPVAKKPFFTGTKEEDIEGYDDDYDLDTDSLDDYEEDPWDEEFADEDDDESSSGSSSSSGTTVTSKRKTGSTTVKRKTTTTTTKKKTTTTTKKTTGSTSPKTPETPEIPKKQYTITLDGDGADMEIASITVEEGGTYQGLPTPSRDEYTFSGWFTKKEGKGTRVEDGDKFTEKADQTLFAYWIEKDPLEVWGNKFEVAANKISEDKINCYVVGDDKAKGIVDACKGVSVEADKSPTCLIVFAKNEDIVDKAAENAYIRYHDGDTEQGIEPMASLTKAIVISDDSIYGNDKSKLMHKIVLLSELYGSFNAEDITKAMTDMGLEPCFMDVYPPTNP